MAKSETEEDQTLPLASALIQIRQSIEQANAHRESSGSPPIFVATDIELELKIAATKEKNSEGRGGLNFSVLGIGFKGEGSKGSKKAEENVHTIRIRFSPIISAEDDKSYKTILNGKEIEIPSSSPLVTIKTGSDARGETSVGFDGQASGGEIGAADTDSLPGGSANFGDPD